MRFTGSILAIFFCAAVANAAVADTASPDAPGAPPADTNSLPPDIVPPQADGPHTLGDNYPVWARRLGEQGVVTVKFTITVGGTVADLSVVKSSGFADLDDAALTAVKAWRYKPATKDGKPIPMPSETNVKFELTDNNGYPMGLPYVELDMTTADYPSDALAAKEEGKVWVGILVSEDGEVISAAMVKPSSSRLLNAASMPLAMKRWHFTPATLDGKPVKSAIVLILNWRLSSTPPSYKH
jgi:TonB family protein